jgi:hypothetical protein
VSFIEEWEEKFRAALAKRNYDGDVFSGESTGFRGAVILIEAAAEKRRLSVRLDDDGTFVAWAVVTPTKIESGDEESFDIDRMFDIFTGD